MNPHTALRAAAVSGTALALALVLETLALGSVSSPLAAEPTASPPPPRVLPGEPWIVLEWDADSTGDYGIYLARPDGSEDHLILTASGGGYVHPDWSPDGSRLAFVNGAYLAIWTADADGSDASSIVDCQSPCNYVDNPAWSPDGTHIAFVRADATNGVFLTSAIDVLDLASGARRTVVESTAPDFLEHVRWSPDGTSLVVEEQRYPSDQPLPVVGAGPQYVGSAIGIADISGPGVATPRFLTEWDMLAAYPDWNRSDGRIIFTTYDLSYWETSDQPSNLFTIKPDGTELTQLTHYGPSQIRDTQPTWTPDGKHIIFTQVGTDHYNGFRVPRNFAFMDPDGTSLQVIGINATHSRLRPTP